MMRQWALRLIVAAMGFAAMVCLVMAPGQARVDTFTSPLPPGMIMIPQVVVAPYPREAPSLHNIANTDHDRDYEISWTPSQPITRYILEEATTPDFSDARRVYEGPRTSVPHGRHVPGTYYYRVKAQHNWVDSPWSNAASITIHPLFVGLQVRWDGEGHIYLGPYYFKGGTHWPCTFNGLTDPDTIRGHNHHWYQPNPGDWESTEWDSFYSVSTGNLLATSKPPEPMWKWGHPRILPYDLQLHHLETVDIGGQPFLVSGPFTGHTAFGLPVQYWRLINTRKFLFRDDGDALRQFVHPGDVTLWYDAGPSRLLLHRDVLRRFYVNDQVISDTVQWISNLTCANSFPGVESCDVWQGISLSDNATQTPSWSCEQCEAAQ